MIFVVKMQVTAVTAATHEYVSFIGKKVPDQDNGVWTIETVMTRMLPTNSILPNKSQPFSIVWADDTARSVIFLVC